MKTITQQDYDILQPMPLFSTTMRAANRDGTKTQTRRILKLPAWSTGHWADFELDSDLDSVFNTQEMPYDVPLVICQDTGCQAEIRCPHGYPNEIHYMREPLFRGEDGFAYYADDNGDHQKIHQVMAITSLPSMYLDRQPVHHLMTGERVQWQWKKDSLSGMYMPKYAARTFTKYKFLRVERLQDISRDDARAEGVGNVWKWDKTKNLDLFDRGVLNPYVANYSVLWDSLNAARGYPWESNPFVWVIGYEKAEL